MTKYFIMFTNNSDFLNYTSNKSISDSSLQSSGGCTVYTINDDDSSYKLDIGFRKAMIK